MSIIIGISPWTFARLIADVNKVSISGIIVGWFIVSIFAAVMAGIIVGIQLYEAAHDIVNALWTETVFVISFPSHIVFNRGA